MRRLVRFARGGEDGAIGEAVDVTIMFHVRERRRKRAQRASRPSYRVYLAGGKHVHVYVYRGRYGAHSWKLAERRTVGNERGAHWAGRL